MCISDMQEYRPETIEGSLAQLAELQQQQNPMLLLIRIQRFTCLLENREPSMKKAVWLPIARMH